MARYLTGHDITVKSEALRTASRMLASLAHAPRSRTYLKIAAYYEQIHPVPTSSFASSRNRGIYRVKCAMPLIQGVRASSAIQVTEGELHSLRRQSAGQPTHGVRGPLWGAQLVSRHSGLGQNRSLSSAGAISERKV
jgi:hypothetical protein